MAWTNGPANVLMHAQNFGREPAPVGECILLAGAYGLNLNALASPNGILRRGKTVEPKSASADNTEDSGDDSTDAAGQPKGSNTALRLLRYDERLQPDLGETAAPTASYLWSIRFIALPANTPRVTWAASASTVTALL